MTSVRIVKILMVFIPAKVKTIQYKYLHLYLDKNK